MAVILVLVSGALGFGSAVVALTVFDVTLLQAFLLWMSGGFLAMLLASLPLLMPRRPIADRSPAEAA
jgi:hypothetical protein